MPLRYTQARLTENVPQRAWDEASVLIDDSVQDALAKKTHSQGGECRLARHRQTRGAPAYHGVCFACASLAIRQHSSVEAFQHIGHEGASDLVVHIILGGCRREGSVKVKVSAPRLTDKGRESTQV